MRVTISKSARKFCQEKGIDEVTFNLFECNVTGCCLGFVKEIQAVYKAPSNASGYRYYKVDGFHVFIARAIKRLGPLTLSTEGIWNRRLCLNGAVIPI